jgi:hypothetical protein
MLTRDTFLELEPLHSMMSQVDEERSISPCIFTSISLYPFTPLGYPTKIHYVLYGSSAFLFSEGIWAHAREPKI